MKTYVARAQLVSYLTRDQLEAVQSRERFRGYLIPNWNIQEVLGIPTIKERYRLPEDNELLARHNQRIEGELKAKGFLKVDQYLEESLEWNHAVDWNVFNGAGVIVWEAAGLSSGRGGGVLSRLRKEKEIEA